VKSLSENLKQNDTEKCCKLATEVFEMSSEEQQYQKDKSSADRQSQHDQ